MHILIIKMSSLGDVIHCLPSLAAIRKGFPEATIDWLVEKQNAEIIKGHPYIDRLIILNKKEWIKRSWLKGGVYHEILRFIKDLRVREYDLIIDFQGLFKSGLVMWLSRGKRKIGFERVREKAGLFYTEKVPLSTIEQHAVTRYLEIPRYLGLDAGKPDFFLHIPIEAFEESYILSEKIGLDIRGNKRIIFINPNCRWQSKKWPWVYFKELIKRLSEKETNEIVLIGGSEDKVGMSEAFSGLGGNVRIIAGCISLMGLAAIFRKGDCLITNDSGPMHLAVAVGLPVVALFGPTNPVRTGPFGWENGAGMQGINILTEKGDPGPSSRTSLCMKNKVLFSRKSCSPCYKRVCREKDCLKDISVSQVLRAIDEVLDTRSRAPGPKVGAS